MGMRYIGAKTRIADQIIDVLDQSGPQSGEYLVDAFCGTGSVASAAADAGWKIRLNDHLYSSATMAAARLVSTSDAPFEALGGYQSALNALTQASPVEGFIYRQYSPASGQYAGIVRKYFTLENAARIDGARRRLEEWEQSGVTTAVEHRLLIADLMISANRIANIAGTYGCFLNRWSPSALRPFEVEGRKLRTTPVEVDLHVGDVMDVPFGENDVAYLDPPYTKRQYAAYYHILETIAKGDEPAVDGVTGLRPWRHLASDFSYRSRALTALIDLVSSCPARRVLLSYSSEGHVPKYELVEALKPLGSLVVHELGEIGRYRPNATASLAGNQVQEYLLDFVHQPAEVDSFA